MDNIRKHIVEKINNQSQFELTHYELEFIVKNWITIHSQHISKVELFTDTSSFEILANVKLDKESIYKHY